MDLQEYERKKFAIADVLRSASVLGDSHDHAWAERLRDLFGRLAQDQFNLVVAGRFSRGKTTLMNAVMGMDRLPAGILPVTSVITAVCYGSEEKVSVQYEGWSLEQQIPFESLPQYVTQEGNPANARKIKQVEIQLPAEILRLGFTFVDTPGLGSAIAVNTRTTEGFLPEVDALLVVTGYESPLADEEMRLIEGAKFARLPLFVVVNKHDTVSAGERAAALSYVSDQIKAEAGLAPPLFSVSTREGLAAKLCQNRARLAESGLPRLEDELIRFLLTKKQSEFLAGMYVRTFGLVRDLPASLKKEDLLSRLGPLRTALELESGNDTVHTQVAVVPQGPRFRPCEICTAVAEAQFNFLKNFQYDLCYEPTAQDRLAKHGGLCSFHTREFERISSQLGLCIGYPPLLEQLAEQLRAVTQGGAKNLCALLPSQESCLVCSIHTQTEREAVQRLAQRLCEGTAPSAGAEPGLCLAHLVRLSEAVGDNGLMAGLANRQADILERLAEDMRRLSLKHDALRRFLATAEEMSAADHALSILAGHKRLGFPPPLVSDIYAGVCK